MMKDIKESIEDEKIMVKMLKGIKEKIKMIKLKKWKGKN